MDPLCVVILDVLMKEAVQVPLVEYNHVIQQLATNTDYRGENLARARVYHLRMENRGRADKLSDSNVDEH